jgi:hypothetical protein
VPLVNSTVEQAKEQANQWKKSPEAAQLRNYLKEHTDKLYSQVFQISPPNVNTKPTPETTTTPTQPEDKKN